MTNEKTKVGRKSYLQTKEGRRNIINCVIAVLIAVIFLFLFTGCFKCPLRRIWKASEKLSPIILMNLQ